MTNGNNIQTGAVSGIKAGAINAVEEHKKQEELAAKEADSMEPKEGDVLYTKVGEPVFNTIAGATNKRISFIGGKFMVTKDDPDAEEFKEVLDYFVSRGTLTKKEG